MVANKIIFAITRYLIRTWPVLPLLLSALMGASSAHAMRAIFFQPQLKDMSVPVTNWPQIFKAARAQGFDTLVIQWSEYGTIFNQDKEQSWLKARVDDAITAQLNIVMGLYADPDMFAQVDSPNELMQEYLLTYLNKNRRLAAYWQSNIEASAIKGWYLPLEIDDRRWRDMKARSILAQYLAREVKNISDIQALPVYISSFFRANTSPEGYLQILSDLHRESSINIWVQDGKGTSPLTANETQLYIQPFENCKQQNIAGVVYEVFRQTGTDAAFKADPLPLKQRSEALMQTAPCGLDTLFFSLRYVVDFYSTK